MAGPDFTDVTSCEAELDETSCMCNVCDDYGLGVTDVQVQCSDGALSDCFGVVTTDLDSLSIPEFFGTGGDGLGMGGDMDPSDMA